MLKGEDPDALVIMQRDAEGNGYSPFSGYWRGAYEAETTWRGHAGIASLTEELREQGYSEDDVVRGHKAVVLKPVN